MRKRCPSARKIGVAYALAYRLVFNRKGSYRDGGVASISPTGNSTDRVYGIVWELTAKDIQILDEIEDPEAYNRIPISVVGLNGIDLTCHTYVAIPQAEHITADREYLNILLAAAHKESLPPEYIETMARYKTDSGEKREE